MPQMTDPVVALESFQKSLANDKILLQPGVIDPALFVYLDHPNSKVRFTYVRLDHRIVTALVMLVLVDPIDGCPCFQIGCAVPDRYRAQGRAKDIIAAAIAELKRGLFTESKISTFYVEAVVGIDNEPSQRASAATISLFPTQITDVFSGLPALRYIRKITSSSS